MIISMHIVGFADAAATIYTFRCYSSFFRIGYFEYPFFTKFETRKNIQEY